MKLYSVKTFLVVFVAVVFLSGTIVFAQDKSAKEYKNREFCSGDNYNYRGRQSFKELRETNTNATNLLSVDGQRNGGIRIKGENRNDILIRACIQTTGNTEQEAATIAKSIRIATGAKILAENTPDNEPWGVSYEILVPRSTNLKLTAQNGGISISGVEGSMNFETQNGGIHLDNVAGNVKGKTINGGVHVELYGNGWNGSGLDVETTNGGVHLSLPETYAAHVETGTVNGGFKSEISQLNVERKDRTREIRLATDLNGGGAPIRVVTKNGGVHINSIGNNM